MQQAFDFLEECRSLHEVVSSATEQDLALETKFKGWTVSDILRHLAVWDSAARLTLQNADAFQQFFAPVPTHMLRQTLREFERDTLPCDGSMLVSYWWSKCRETAEIFALADPKQRLRWGGPDLSARTCINARLMETWAHSQAIYDEFGIVRVDSDRIKNIVQIGLQTFSWTFQNRQINPPGPVPNLELVAPNGEEWRWRNPQSTERIVGSATEFCQVVTQVRNVADTSLRMCGPTSRSWMAVAQCFAGPPSDPPRPGERYRKLATQ